MKKASMKKWRSKNNVLKKSSAQKVYDWVILEEKPETFVGYDQTSSETYITRYRKSRK